MINKTIKIMFDKLRARVKASGTIINQYVSKVIAQQKLKIERDYYLIKSLFFTLSRTGLTPGHATIGWAFILFAVIASIVSILTCIGCWEVVISTRGTASEIEYLKESYQMVLIIVYYQVRFVIQPAVYLGITNLYASLSIKTPKNTLLSRIFAILVLFVLITANFYLILDLFHISGIPDVFRIPFYFVCSNIFKLNRGSISSDILGVVRNLSVVVWFLSHINTIFLIRSFSPSERGTGFYLLLIHTFYLIVKSGSKLLKLYYEKEILFSFFS